MNVPVGIKVVVVLAALALAWLVTESAETTWGQILLSVLLIALVMAFGVFRRSEPNLPLLTDPMVLCCAFLAQFFIVGPLSLPLFSYRITGIALPIELVVGTLFRFLVLLVCFIAAYELKVGPILAGLLPDFRGGRLKLPGRTAEVLILGGSIFGCYQYLEDRGGVLGILGTGYGTVKFTALYQLPFHALILGTLLMVWRLADSPRASRLDWAIFGLLMAVEIPFYAVALGARNRLFFLFFGIYTVWTLRRGVTRWWRRATVPILVVLMVFFAFWGSIRARPLVEVVKGGGDPLQPQTEAHMGYFTAVAEPFAVSALVVQLFPDTEPYRHGRTLLVTLLGFIPRSMWPEKPVGFGKEITRYTDGVFYKSTYGHSLTVTLLGDFWANGGWVGVVLGGLGFGILCRTMASYAVRGMKDGRIQLGPAQVLGMAVFTSSLPEVRAETANILAFWGMTVPWLLLALVFCRLDYSQAETSAAHQQNPAPDSPALQIR